MRRPILSLTDQIAKSIPALSNQQLAKASATLLITALLRAYQTGARATLRAQQSRKHDSETSLLEAAEKAREIDIDRAKRAKERAEKRLAQAKTEDVDYTRAEMALKRALLRLRIAEKGR